MTSEALMITRTSLPSAMPSSSTESTVIAAVIVMPATATVTFAVAAPRVIFSTRPGSLLRALILIGFSWTLDRQPHSTRACAPGQVRSNAPSASDLCKDCGRCQPVPMGDSMSEQEDSLARVMNLMRDLERLLIEIKEAVIPVLVGSNEPIETAWRGRTFLRLARRMPE